MRNPSESTRRLGPAMLVLLACTLWLVVQNTVLALLFLWIEPRKTVTLATMILKAGMHLIAGFWDSPAAPLSIGVLLVIGLAAPAMFGRSVNREVIHG